MRDSGAIVGVFTQELELVLPADPVQLFRVAQNAAVGTAREAAIRCESTHQKFKKSTDHSDMYTEYGIDSLENTPTTPDEFALGSAQKDRLRCAVRERKRAASPVVIDAVEIRIASKEEQEPRRCRVHQALGVHLEPSCVEPDVVAEVIADGIEWHEEGRAVLLLRVLVKIRVGVLGLGRLAFDVWSADQAQLAPPFLEVNCGVQRYFPSATTDGMWKAALEI